ncbi:tyrosine-type recombinase/integrase [Schlesneria sp. DSM 10557]|uniref:tyrosine-type recombinase/integrase n=1 Tax=Schlesneria sp. DSM 10557 TaxID=3044399 RepID=UPI00359FFF99
MAAKKRGHGEGSIFQRGNGRWTAAITVGTNADGKRIRKWVSGKTKKEVTDELTKLQGQKLNGTLVDSGRMTVGELIDKWLETSSRPNTEPNTHARYEGIARLHVKPAVGSIKLSKFNPMHVQTMLSTMEAANVGERTRGHVYAVLRRALNVGLRWGLVVRNVCDAVDPPKQKRAEIVTLLEDQVLSLISAAEGTRWHALFVVALATGLRQGELFALKWIDIDLENGVLSVRHSLEELKGKLRLKEPKSKSGRRQVTLPAGAIAALRSHKAIQAAEGLESSELVFCAAEGGFLRKSNFERRVWNKFRDKAKIPDTITFHDLRHTSATILLGAGVHPKIVQERLGHSSIQLTMDTYSHILPTMQQDAATKLDHIGRVNESPKP